MADKSKRRQNFAEEELFAMIEGVKNKKHIILGKFDSSVTSKAKQAAWESVTHDINLVSRVG